MSERRMRLGRTVIGAAVTACVVFAAGGFVGAIYFGSLAGLGAFVRGRSVHVSPRVVDLGQRQAGAEITLPVSIRNLTLTEMTIVGKRSTCQCIMSGRLPMRLPPRETVEIDITLRLGGSQHPYEERIVFLVAEQGRLTMHAVTITATVLQSSAMAGHEAGATTSALHVRHKR